MDGRGGMRAGDADRDEVAARLRAALDEGRLNLYEYDERLQQAYAARTYAELDALLVDLPGSLPADSAQLAPVEPGQLTPVGPVGPGAAPAVEGRDVTGRWLAETWTGYLQVVGTVASIWAVTSLISGGWLYFWPVWVAGPWGAVLLVQTVTGLVSGEPRKWAEKRERKYREKQERRAELRDQPDPEAG